MCPRFLLCPSDFDKGFFSQEALFLAGRYKYSGNFMRSSNFAQVVRDHGILPSQEGDDGRIRPFPNQPGSRV